jgi:hypothetical protein
LAVGDLELAEPGQLERVVVAPRAGALDRDLGYADALRERFPGAAVVDVDTVHRKLPDIEVSQVDVRAAGEMNGGAASPGTVEDGRIFRVGSLDDDGFVFRTLQAGHVDSAAVYAGCDCSASRRASRESTGLAVRGPAPRKSSVRKRPGATGFIGSSYLLQR